MAAGGHPCPQPGRPCPQPGHPCPHPAGPGAAVTFPAGDALGIRPALQRHHQATGRTATHTAAAQKFTILFIESATNNYWGFLILFSSYMPQPSSLCYHKKDAANHSAALQSEFILQLKEKGQLLTSDSYGTRSQTEHIPLL